MNDAITVTQFVEVVNFTLDAIETVVVEGEVGEFRIIHNKWVTFSLKDQESSVNCFMTTWQYKAQIEDGMLVKAIGKPRLRNKGFFSFVLDSVEPSGEGALQRAFELLKRRLEVEGIFASDRKRALPRFPQHIAFITSRDAAAYNDFLKVLQGRTGGLTISFIHTQVQGEDAPRQIVAALQTANTELKNLDAIVLVRGGGSLEDLHAFNSEEVVRAVAASRAPTIVGIGHERDVCLAELAADMRASTPSNAAELLVRSRAEMVSQVTFMQDKLSQSMREELSRQERFVANAMRTLKGRVVETGSHIRQHITSLQAFGLRFRQTIGSFRDQVLTRENAHARHMEVALGQKRDAMKQLTRVLQSFSPYQTLARGYSITRLNDGSLVRTAAAAKQGATILTRLADGEITSTVTTES